MMDMLSPVVATTLLVIALVAAAAGFVAMRVLGARAVEGDHPGDKGYSQTSADHPHWGPTSEREQP